ncbi:hypothetical protein BTJ49_14745 [Oleiagrimonas sp. MCCC 1A03011]|nr:hypothetical protein BTJ49_14745 [Oleiagrimonas sp. MCCC 1A03011]
MHDELSGMWTWIKRHRLLVGLAVIVMLGLALGWNWLAAAGALPFLYFLPCVLMMGKCMKDMGSGKTGNAQDKQDEQPQAESTLTVPPASLPARPPQQLIKEKDHA